MIEFGVIMAVFVAGIAVGAIAERQIGGGENNAEGE